MNQQTKKRSRITGENTEQDDEEIKYIKEGKVRDINGKEKLVGKLLNNLKEKMMTGK